MNSNKLLSVVLGALILCPGIKACEKGAKSFGEQVQDTVATGLKQVGRGSVDVASEALLMVTATHGLKQVAEGVAEAVPATCKILKSTGLALIGRKDEQASDVYKKALLGTVRGLYGAIVTCISLYMAVETVPWIDGRMVYELGLAKNDSKN